MGFEQDCASTAAALVAFAEASRERKRPVIVQPSMAVLAERLGLADLIRHGGLTGERLDRFLSVYLAQSTSLHHPHYMAHQVAIPHHSSAIAALVDAFTNNEMAIYEMGPPAATVEFVVLNWMLEKAGWTPPAMPGATEPATAQRTGVPVAGGVFTDGGSLANLTALLAARSRALPAAWMNGADKPLVIIASPASHYSVTRAAGIMGLGQRAVLAAPTDALGRIDAARLAPFLADLARDGHLVMAVVANACSTALGLYDRLRDIAGACREAGVWLHVDGAHGASALVSPHHRARLDGLELADSLVWDAHKMLRTSAVSAAVLVRDAASLDGAFHEEASYLFHDKDEPGCDFIHRTVECTKPALALKLFFALAAEGEAAMAAFIDRQFALATAAAQYLRSEPGIEVATEPEANIVCFRLEGSDGLQLALRKRLLASGDFYISTTEAMGRRWLRIALMNPATGLSDIEALVSALRRHAEALR